MAIAIVAAGIYLQYVLRTPSSSPSNVNSGTAQPLAHADFVGAAACKQCHESEIRAWTGSHHQLAMQEMNASTVLGKFEAAKFRAFGVESTFFKRDGKFMVRTDGTDGKLAVRCGNARGCWANWKRRTERILSQKHIEVDPPSYYV